MHIRDGLIRRRKNGTSILKKLFTMPGQSNLSVSTIEQCDTKFGFKISHLFTDRRLRHVQQARSTSKTTIFSDCDEVA